MRIVRLFPAVRYAMVLAIFCVPVFCQRKCLRDRIPRADNRSYAGVQYATDWRNPFLIIHASGVEVWRPHRGLFPMSEVLRVLNALPRSAWPYGLVVAVAPMDLLTSVDDGVKIQANQETLTKALKAHGVAVNPWP